MSAKIRNPATGRLVKPDGRIGKKLVKEQERLAGFVNFQLLDLPAPVLQRIAELLQSSQDVRDAVNFSSIAKTIRSHVYFSDQVRLAVSIEDKVLRSRPNWSMSFENTDDYGILHSGIFHIGIEFEHNKKTIGAYFNFVTIYRYPSDFWEPPLKALETFAMKCVTFCIGTSRVCIGDYVGDYDDIQMYPAFVNEYRNLMKRVIVAVYAIIKLERGACISFPTPNQPQYPFNLLWHKNSTSRLCNLLDKSSTNHIPLHKETMRFMGKRFIPTSTAFTPVRIEDDYFEGDDNWGWFGADLE